MAILYYDFQRATNGSGASMDDARNTWANPGNGDVIRFKPGGTWVRASQVSFGAFTGLTIEPWPTYYDTPGAAKPRIVHTAASTFAWNFQGDGVHVLKDLEFRDCSTNLNGGVVGSGLVAATGVYAALDLERCDFYNTAYNAVRLSGVSTQAAPTFRARWCNFDDIGEDAIYGGAIDYEVGWCRMTRLSQHTETGDGIGFLGATPTRAWIHDGYIDHRGNTAKHCIIIDKTGGAAGTGVALIERMTLLADGTVNVNFVGCNGVVRWNRITAGDIAFASDTAGTKYYRNRISVLGYRNSSQASIPLTANNQEVIGNTILAASGGVLVASGTSTSGHLLRNNAVLGGTTFYKRGGSASETRSNNGFQGTASPYLDSSDVAIALAGSDIAATGLMGPNGRPLKGSRLLTEGHDQGLVRDADGVQGRKFIGAYAPAAMRWHA